MPRIRVAFLGAIAGFALLTPAVRLSAQSPLPHHLRGTISDYTPVSVLPGAGPWAIRGQWSLTVKGDSGLADFDADVVMVRSDYWFVANVQNPETTSLRGFHTHHLIIRGGTVTPVPGGFEVSGGDFTITKDGGPAPLPGSTLIVTVTGGSLVTYSNIALVFGGGAAGHLGSQPIHGVVLRIRSDDDDH